MFTRLRNRLLLLNLALISLVMIGAFAVIYSITYRNVQKENLDKLRSIPTFSGIAALSRPDTKVIIGRMPVDPSLTFAVLVDRAGEVAGIYSYVDLPDEAYYRLAERVWQAGRPQGVVSAEHRKWQYLVTSFEHRRLFIEGETPVIISDGLYQLSFLDITQSSQTLTQLLVTFVLVGMGMLVILLGVSLHFANAAIRPIADNWDRQKQFVADASHELKTPLAIISANADALLANGERTVSSQQKWVDYIRSEAGRMGRLVNDMLYLAKVEDTHANQVPFDLSHVVLDAIAAMEALLFEKGINLTHTVEPDIIVRGDGERIKQAVLILLDNAAKYTDPTGKVAVTLRRARNRAVFAVQNSGEGIPPDRLPRIFDRFYRGDPSRSQETGGYGLGLSIAKAVVERSGGSIRADSAQDRTTFSFELKLA